MVNLFMAAIRDKVEAMPFVERYGGLALPVSKNFNEGDTENPKWITKTYPVSSYVNQAECWEKQRYKQLIPNAKYKSIFYWEHNGNGKTTTGQFTETTMSLSLVGWLNIPELNLNNADSSEISHLVVPFILKELSDLKLLQSDAQFDITFLNQERKSPGIFSRYTYEFDHGLYPYDYFKLNFEVSMKMNFDCVTVATLGTPVDCIKI